MNHNKVKLLILENYYSIESLLPFIYEKALLIPQTPISTQNFTGFNYIKYTQYRSNDSALNSQILLNKNYLIIPQFFNGNDTHLLKTFFHSCHAETMSINSVQKAYGNNNLGIQRVSIYDFNYAWHLFIKILPSIPLFKIIDNDLYIAVQLNPLLRFIQYQEGNSLVPHVDSSVTLAPNIHTFSTFLLYLTDNVYGHTRFLSQDNIEDSIEPEEGKAIIFDHNIIHDSQLYIKKNLKEENKLVLTSEVAYHKLNQEDLDYLSSIKQIDIY